MDVFECFKLFLVISAYQMLILHIPNQTFLGFKLTFGYLIIIHYSLHVLEECNCLDHKEKERGEKKKKEKERKRESVRVDKLM